MDHPVQVGPGHLPGGQRTATGTAAATEGRQRPRRPSGQPDDCHGVHLVRRRPHLPQHLRNAEHAEAEEPSGAGGLASENLFVAHLQGLAKYLNLLILWLLHS